MQLPLDVFLSSPWLVRLTALTTAHQSSDAVSVAGVHATILGIFAAITLTYLGIYLGSLHALRQAILDQVNDIGRRRVRFTAHHPAEDENYDGRDADARRQFVSNVNAIAMKLPAWQPLAR